MSLNNLELIPTCHPRNQKAKARDTWLRGEGRNSEGTGDGLHVKKKSNSYESCGVKFDLGQNGTIRLRGSAWRSSQTLLQEARGKVGMEVILVEGGYVHLGTCFFWQRILLVLTVAADHEEPSSP